MGIAAAIAGAGIGGAAISGISENSAANTAAQTAQQTTAADNALQAQIYQTNTANEQPYMQAGSAAGTTIAGLLGTGGNAAASNSALQQYLGSTGYNFQLQQGGNAITQQAAATGELGSGALLKALNNYGQGEASSAFQNYISNLQTQQNTGLSATNALAGVGTNFANASNANSNAAASTTANAALASAGATTGAINSSANSALSAYALSSGLSSYGGGGADPYAATLNLDGLAGQPLPGLGGG